MVSTSIIKIPKDWKLVQIGDHFDFKNGLNKAKKFFGEGTPIINYMDVYPYPSIEEEKIKGKVTLSNDELRNFEARKGDVIFTRTSETIEEIGLSSVVLDDVKKTVFSGFLLRARPKTKLFELEFKKYCFRSKNIRKQIISTSSQTTRALTNGKLLSKVSLVIPKNPQEQIAIANSISDIEKLIKKLTTIIIKKKNIKQGIMQELLTGKKRLEGFNEEWKVDFLKDIGEITGAGVDKKIKQSETPVRLVNYLDVYNEDFIYSKNLNHKVTAPTLQIIRCAVKKGDIFFTPSSEVRDDIGVSAVSMEDIPDSVYSYHVVRLRLFQNSNIKFWNYIFKTKYFLEQCETVCEGSGTRYVITLKKFRRLKIMYPKDPKEQQAISESLYDIDLEINNLETVREKYIMIKNGMMEKLLIGEIRLV
jgi:type I restriction enzyme, S subunit